MTVHSERLKAEARKRAERYAARLKTETLSQIATSEGISRQAVTQLLDRFGLRDKTKAAS